MYMAMINFCRNINKVDERINNFVWENESTIVRMSCGLATDILVAKVGKAFRSLRKTRHYPKPTCESFFCADFEKCLTINLNMISLCRALRFFFLYFLTILTTPRGRLQGIRRKRHFLSPLLIFILDSFTNSLIFCIKEIVCHPYTPALRLYFVIWFCLGDTQSSQQGWGRVRSLWSSRVYK